MAVRWHVQTAAEVADTLGVDPSVGLSGRDAESRAASGGPNEIPEATQQSALALLVDQFRDFLILILIAAAVISIKQPNPRDQR